MVRDTKCILLHVFLLTLYIGKEIMRKIYKVVKLKDGNGTITFYGCNRWSELKYGNNRLLDKEEHGYNDQYFYHYKRKYWLSEILAVNNPIYNPNPPDWQKEFDGFASDSYFSGIVVKLSDCGESVKAFTFISK